MKLVPASDGWVAKLVDFPIAEEWDWGTWCVRRLVPNARNKQIPITTYARALDNPLNFLGTFGGCRVFAACAEYSI